MNAARWLVINLMNERVEYTLPSGKEPHAMAVASGGKIFVNNRGTEKFG